MRAGKKELKEREHSVSDVRERKMLLYLANVVAETQVSIHRKGHQENVLWT